MAGYGEARDWGLALVNDIRDWKAGAITWKDVDDTDARERKFDRKDINGFLECLDGSQDRDSVVVVAACNFPERFDDAVLRSGRIDRHFKGQTSAC
jgi:ATP-dependent 26S proteasome regulatory subunit